MLAEQRVSFQLYEGPSAVAPFRALVAEITHPPGVILDAKDIRALLAALFPGMLRAFPFDGHDRFDFPELVADRAQHWQEAVQPLGLDKRIHREGEGSARIALEYFSPNRIQIALRAGLAIARTVFARAADRSADVSELVGRVRELAALDDGRQFASVSNAYIRAARARGIHVRQVSPTSNVLQYGQGSKSFHQREASTSTDSFTGHRLAEDKSNSNRLIRQLGLPGVEHVVVENIAAARQAAGRIGVPVVIKPVDRNGSMGVTVGVETLPELETAFAEAKRLSDRGRVLVERFVPGDEHRLSVFGGTFFRASRLVIAHIVGDGARTIEALIAADNIRRRGAAAAGDYLFELVQDAKMLAVLKKQDLSPKDVPAAGRKVRLAGTSNLKSGGHREDVTKRIHPENVALAEAVARNFRLDAAGIDFITEDIARPWTETRCAIIEVNSNPGTSVELAAEVMDARFPHGDDGRIPSVLIVDGSQAQAETASRILAAKGSVVGCTTAEKTELGGHRRFVSAVDFPSRVSAMIADSTCDAFVAACTVSDIEKHGLPWAPYDLVVVAAQGISEEMGRLLAANAKRGVLNIKAADIDDELETAIGAL